jgi:hypothetical protein
MHAMMSNVTRAKAGDSSQLPFELGAHNVFATGPTRVSFTSRERYRRASRTNNMSAKLRHLARDVNRNA